MADIVYHTTCEIKPGAYEFLGIFSSKALAHDACLTHWRNTRGFNDGRLLLWIGIGDRSEAKNAPEYKVMGVLLDAPVGTYEYHESEGI